MGATEHGVQAVIGARYRLEYRLGDGGMGVVWAATDVATDERCAVKVMKDAAGDPDARKRFLREGRAAAAVHHPNVVRILDVLEPEGEPPAIIMELLEGESLRARLARDGKLPLSVLAEIVVPVISAVGAAHGLGIVHRDLKPENIFLVHGPAGEIAVKVLDFGIAKLTALDGEAKHSTGVTTDAVLGTPRYMAPEQVFAENDLDHRADIWALGIILYEGLAGVCPTEGNNVGQVLKHVIAKPFEPLAERVPELPAEISALVARMLARERAERPADLHEVLEVLAPFVHISATPFGAPASRPKDAAALATTVALAGPRGPRARAAREGMPGPRRARRRVVLGMGVVFVVAGAIIAWGARSGSGPPVRSAAVSPLALPDAKIACPILRASGVEAPAGWLGAAAAGVACERARVFLGGRPERMLVPAELLDLPRGLAAAIPLDPYGQPGARDRSLIAARQRAQAYLDGEVSRSAAGFAVALSLHRADGGELGRAEGQGLGLYEAVRSAMAPLVDAGLIPKARELEPQIAAWSRTRDIDDALAVLDLGLSSLHNAGGRPDECRRFEQLSARVGELGPEGRWLCAFTLGRPLPEVDLEAAGPADSEASRATRIRINIIVHQTAEPGDVPVLREMFRHEKTARGQSLIAATESCLLSSISSANAQDAIDRAIVAVTTEPKNPEGNWCNPWQQLLSVVRNTMSADSAMRAMQAWVPWDSYGWLEPAFSSGGNDPAALPLLWRAHVLSPLDAHIADTLANSLLASGDRAAARGVAADLRRGGLPLHDVEINLIHVRVETSEARFGAALAQAREASKVSAADTGWIRLQRFELAWHAFELAVLLGRAREVADLLIERFLDPDPPPIDSNSPFVPIRLPAICARASAPDRCFARLRTLRQQLSGAITQDTDDFTLGVERYVKHDLEGAARAWRPLLGGRKMLAAMMPDAMVEAFERTGAADLAEQVDEQVMQRAGEYNGATLGHVRAARRALARGDRAQARQLAEQIVKAWALADDPPPALAEMRALLARPKAR